MAEEGFAPRNPVPESLVAGRRGRAGVRIAHGTVRGLRAVVGTRRRHGAERQQPDVRASRWLPRPFGEANRHHAGPQARARPTRSCSTRRRRASRATGSATRCRSSSSPARRRSSSSSASSGSATATAPPAPPASRFTPRTAQRVVGPRRRVGLHLRRGEAGRLASRAGDQRPQGDRRRRPTARSTRCSPARSWPTSRPAT